MSRNQSASDLIDAPAPLATRVADRRAPIVESASDAPRTLTGEQKLAGDMLLFSSALMVFGSMLWLAIYWSFGQRFSTMVPLLFQLGSACLIFFYLKTRKLALFGVLQLSLFLFTPFIMQWTIGNFVNSSGVSLWALLAPVGAIVILGTRDSVPWFVAYIFLTALSGVFDYTLAWDVRKLDMNTIAVFFVLNFVSVSAMVYVLLWYFSREKSKLRALVDAQAQEVLSEKRLADNLLQNILPPAIAERLKRAETNIADGHADVTVMFADIVNFTHMSEEMSPNETVTLLNDIFSEFEGLTERFGGEKIKTIGDAYMVAGGLREGTLHHAQSYCDAIVDLALAMHEFVSGYTAPNGARLQLRIGIATGPVVAGVIGKRRFGYDLWGDTVNIAARMCSEAAPGHTQVDTVTHRRLYSRYRFDEMKQIEVKGKGPMQVYNLVGRGSQKPPAEDAQKLAATVINISDSLQQRR